MKSELENVLIKNRPAFHQVVKYNPDNEKLFLFDFTAANSELTSETIADTEKFSRYVAAKLETNHASFGIGGYNEDRVLYKRSRHFETSGNTNAGLPESEEGVGSRSVHLGIDIWGPAGTEVLVPVGGMVHSFAFNNNFSDYGATIILQHQLDTIVFYTLYGHVSMVDIAQLHKGKYISRGELIAHFGEPKENGDWPPHLHFQVIGDMNLKEGDYPGVCAKADRERYLQNCPNPDLILNMMQFVE